MNSQRTTPDPTAAAGEPIVILDARLAPYPTALMVLLSAVPAEARGPCLQRCRQIAASSAAVPDPHQAKHLQAALQIIESTEERRALYALIRDSELVTGAKAARAVATAKGPRKAKTTRGARQQPAAASGGGGAHDSKPGGGGAGRASRREEDDAAERAAGNAPDSTNP